jgi:hypothetical protein
MPDPKRDQGQQGGEEKQGDGTGPGQEQKNPSTDFDKSKGQEPQGGRPGQGGSQGGQKPRDDQSGKNH